MNQERAIGVCVTASNNWPETAASNAMPTISRAPVPASVITVPSFFCCTSAPLAIVPPARKRTGAARPPRMPMLETPVVGARIDKMRGSQLLHAAQALERGGVDERDGPRLQQDGAVDGVADGDGQLVGPKAAWS